MKKEVITVPKDKCPLDDVIAVMGRQTESERIFLHWSAEEKSLSSSDKVKYHKQ